MPIRYEIDKEARRVSAVVTGDFTMTDIVEGITHCASDPDFEPGMSILSDHSEIGEPITPDQLQKLVATLRSLSDSFAGVRWAVVATKPASYGMIRMFSVLAESVPMEVEVFRSREEAEAWLAVRVEP